MKVPVATEQVEQEALFRWAAYNQGRLPELAGMYHIANEGKRSRASGGILRAMGMKRGVPDICLPVARGGYHALYIEMKRREGGKLSADQAEWIDWLNVHGSLAVRCDGWEAAARVIEEYMSMPVVHVMLEREDLTRYRL